MRPGTHHGITYFEWVVLRIEPCWLRTTILRLSLCTCDRIEIFGGKYLGRSLFSPQTTGYYGYFSHFPIVENKKETYRRNYGDFSTPVGGMGGGPLLVSLVD